MNEHNLVRFFFLFASIFTLGLGMGLLIFPPVITNIFLDSPIENSGLFFIRFAGTSLIGFSVLNFYAHNKSFELLRLGCLVNIASLLPATIISILTLGGQGYIDNFQWLIILEHVFFLSGFGICFARLHFGKLVE